MVVAVVEHGGCGVCVRVCAWVECARKAIAYKRGGWDAHVEGYGQCRNTVG
jgi:hypothetical protein